MTTKTDPRVKDIAKILSNVDPERLEMVLKKTTSITLRVTEADKADMQMASKECGVTLTEYLTRLHYAARGCLGLARKR